MTNTTTTKTDFDPGYDSQVVRQVKDRHDYTPEEISQLEVAFARECWENAPTIQRTRQVYGDKVALSVDLAKLKHKFRRYVQDRSAGMVELREQAAARTAAREAEQAAAREAKARAAEAERQAAMEAAKVRARQDWLAAGGTLEEFDAYGWEQMRQREMIDRATELARQRKAAVTRQYRQQF